MSDLSALSDEELQALYQKGSGISVHPVSNAPNDLSNMSDADLMKAYAAPTGYLEDAAKSIGAGLGNAAIGTLGMAGDLTNLGAKGIGAASNFINDKLGLGRYQPSQQSILNYIPTSASIRSTVTDPIVSPDYQPQTAIGGVLKKGAEFAPALTQGPGGMGRRFLTNVAAPAVASEIGDKAGGPIGGVVGALAGGMGASKLANSMVTARAIRAATPALSDVKSEATNAYDALTSRNVATPIPQSALDNVASDIRTTLNNRGIRPSNAASIHQAIDEIRTPATPGAADVADLVAARQSIKELLGKTDTNKAGAFVALGKIEKEIEQHSPGTMATMREADKNYSAFKANEALDKKLTRADLRAAGEHSGMNVGNKIRQQVTNYLLSSEAKYLSAETKADLEKIVRGTASQNLVRHVANLLGGGGGLGMMIGGGAGYEAGGLPGMAAGAALGRGFKIANNRSVVKQAEQVAQNIRMRSPLGQQTPLALPPTSSPLLAGLLSAYLAKPKQ